MLHILLFAWRYVNNHNSTNFVVVSNRAYEFVLLLLFRSLNAYCLHFSIRIIYLPQLLYRLYRFFTSKLSGVINEDINIEDDYDKVIDEDSEAVDEFDPDEEEDF